MNHNLGTLIGHSVLDFWNPWRLGDLYFFAINFKALRILPQTSLRVKLNAKTHLAKWFRDCLAMAIEHKFGLKVTTTGWFYKNLGWGEYRPVSNPWQCAKYHLNDGDDVTDDCVKKTCLVLVIKIQSQWNICKEEGFVSSSATDRPLKTRELHKNRSNEIVVYLSMSIRAHEN